VGAFLRTVKGQPIYILLLLAVQQYKLLVVSIPSERCYVAKRFKHNVGTKFGI